MTTKDLCFRDKSKNFLNPLFDYSNNDNGQYNNLNLNQNHKFTTFNNFVHSKRSTSFKNGQKSCDLNDSNNLQSKNDKILLNECEKTLKTFASLKLCDEIDKKEEKKKAGNSNANNNNKSTLSLHISAYENFVETSSNLNSNKLSTNKKKTIGKTIKEIFFGSTTTVIQNPFEFPRQQKESVGMEPEIMQFKASQRLLNSNTLNNSGSNNTITISSSEEEDADSDIEITYIKKRSDVRNEESDGIKAESNRLLAPPSTSSVPWHASSSIPMASTSTNFSYFPQTRPQVQQPEQQQQQYFPRHRPFHYIPIRPYPSEFNQTTFIQTNNHNPNPLNLPQPFRARWIYPSQMYGYNFIPPQPYGFVRGEYRNSPTIRYSPMPMNIQPQQQQQQQQPPSFGIPPWNVRFMSGPSTYLTSGLPLYFPPPPVPVPIPLPVPPPPAQYFIQNHNNNNNFEELIDSIANKTNIEKRNKNSTPATTNANLNSEAPDTFSISPSEPTPAKMNEEFQMPHYQNITEQMPEENDSTQDFVHNLLNQMGQQFRAEPLVQPIRLRIHPLPVNTELEKVESHRLFKIGNDKRGKTQARVWIDTPNDDTKVFLYRHSEKDSDPNKDVFVCIQCSRHNRVTKFEIRRTENEDLELWEQPTHYPSCYRIKEEIESIQAKYDKRRSSMNNSMNGTSIENSFNTSGNSFGSSKPRTKNNDYHYIGHRVVPETDYVFGVNEKGSIKSRILVRDEFNPALGRVYSFHPAKRADGRSIFYCRNCNPKKYAPVTVGDEDGEFTVREAPLARHELNCLPVSFDELIEKQQQLEEKLQRKGVPLLDFSNITENGDGSILGNNGIPRARSPTIALRSREPTVEPQSRSRSPTRSPIQQRARTRTRSTEPRTRNRTRSRSPLNGSLNSSNSSLSLSAARRGRRPIVHLMRIVPNNCWRCEDPKNIGLGSKLFIFTDLDAKVGREFHFCELGLDGQSYFFNCFNCIKLTANRQRTKGYLVIEDDKIEVREGRHYPTCRPYLLQDVPNSLPENERPDEIPMEISIDQHVVDEPPMPTVKVSRSSLSSKPKSSAPASVPEVTSEMDETSPSLSPELGVPSSSSSTSFSKKQRDDRETLPTPTPPPMQKQFPTAASSTSSSSSSTILSAKPVISISFTPKILPRDRTVFYNVPSSSQMRNASKILGVEYNKDGQVFWSNTMQWISEFRGTSRPTEIRTIQSQKFSGWSSLAIFFTGNEEYGFEIQKAVKAYFFQNFFTGKSCQLPEDIIRETLVSNELTDIHLALFARMTNCIIGVFDGPNLKMYGASDDENSPTMLLKKVGKIYSPVTNIQT